MYCPTCAAQNEAGVKFCRSCGQELTLIAQALTKSGPVMLLGQIRNELQEDKERQKQPRITRGLFWTGISIVFFILWCLRLYQHSAEFGTVVLGLINAFLILGFGVREFVRYLLLDPGDEKHLPVSQEQWGHILDLAPRELAKKSPPSAGPIPSVTEPTTRQLDAKHQGSHDTKRN